MEAKHYFISNRMISIVQIVV